MQRSNHFANIILWGAVKMQLFPLSTSCNKNMTRNRCHDLKWEFWRLKKCKMVSFVSSAQSNISFYVI